MSLNWLSCRFSRTVGVGWVFSWLMSVSFPLHADSELDPLIEVLVEVNDPQVQLDILTGIQAATRGQRSLDMPATWRRAYPLLRKSGNRQVRQRSMLLAARFQDQRAIGDLFAVLNDKQEPPAWRQTALTTLVQLRVPQIQKHLSTLIRERGPLRGDAIRALAAFENPQLTAALIKQYKSLSAREQQDTISTLCSRRESARSLWTAIENKQIPVDDLSAYAVRQLMALEDPVISEKLSVSWGSLRFTPQDRKMRLAKYKQMLVNGNLGVPDVEAGKAVFVRTCASCHELFGEGGKVGPKLTGSQRTNLDYLLENLIDPNALIGRDYQVTTVIAEGRVITGIIADESAAVLTIRTPTDTIRIPVDEIEARKKSPVSMMPEGMLDKLTPQELRDLIAYIGSDGSSKIKE